MTYIPFLLMLGYNKVSGQEIDFLLPGWLTFYPGSRLGNISQGSSKNSITKGVLLVNENEGIAIIVATAHTTIKK